MKVTRTEIMRPWPQVAKHREVGVSHCRKAGSANTDTERGAEGARRRVRRKPREL